MLQQVTNRAAEFGPDRFKWWMDWRGQSVAIVACGPSAKNANVAALRGRLPVIAIKEAHLRLATWSDVVYGCEAPWWNNARGLPDYKGLRLAWNEAPINFPHVERFKLKARLHDHLILDEPGVIGAGGHSGFQALNVALQFGAVRVLLVGFDLTAGGGLHFYGRNNWSQANNPDDTAFPRWVRALDAAALDLKRWGVEVVNASPTSACRAFRHLTVEQTLEEWRL